MNDKWMVIFSIMFLLKVASVQGENLALNKPYEMSPAPNYDQCKDAGDAMQLTDGKTLGVSWEKSTTVGWNWQPRVTVTIDLGKVQPIGKVIFFAAGHNPDSVIHLPAVTAVLISDDGKEYFPAAAIGSGMLDQHSGQTGYKLETPDLAVRGRYVRLVFQTEERSLYLDEIEVIAGNESVEVKPMEAITPERLEELFKTGLKARWVMEEWKEARKQIKSLGGKGIDQKIHEIDRRMEQLDITDAKAVDEVHQDYLLLRAQSARPLIGTDLIVQKVSPWSDLRASWFPSIKTMSKPSAEVLLWEDEYESLAFGVANLSDQPKKLVLSLDELTDKSGKTISWDKRLWLRQAYPVHTSQGWRNLDALTLLGQGDKNRNELILPAGETRVLWLTLFSRDLIPGKYHAQFRVIADKLEKPEVVVPLTITVAPLRMPPVAERSIKGYQWDYLVGWNVPKDAAEDMRAHGTNVFFLHPLALPRPSFNADRTKLESVDFKELDIALNRVGNPELHAVYWSGEASKLFKIENPAEQTLFKEYIKCWKNYLEKKGYGPERYFFYIYDECVPKEFIIMARLIKEVDSRLQVFCNFTGGPFEDLQAIAPYVDIWCPLATDFPGYGGDKEMSKDKYKAFCDLRKQYNFKLWTYDCNGPGETFPSDTYYRRISWCAFKNGATGSGFWCYAPTISPWYRFDANVSYALIYYSSDAPKDVPRTEAIIPSRRWEAVREGREDYEYLHRLQKTINVARKAGVSQSSLARAERTMQRVVKDVLENTADLDRYDRARHDLTQEILKLNNEF